MTLETRGSSKEGVVAASSVQPRTSQPLTIQSGYVQSIGVSSISLKTDEGRTVTVDVAQVGDDARRSIRPGDLVSVVGRAESDGRFTAEVVQRDR